MEGPAKPSRQVPSLVRAALTHVCTLLMCHTKSTPAGFPVRPSSLTDWLRRSTLSPMVSMQSCTAPYSLGLSPLAWDMFFTNDALDLVLDMLTDKAVMASFRSLWPIKLA